MHRSQKTLDSARAPDCISYRKQFMRSQQATNGCPLQRSFDIGHAAKRRNTLQPVYVNRFIRCLQQQLYPFKIAGGLKLLRRFPSH
ncbi:hypothetical protein D3C76_1652270 [compost metagenome]